MQKPLKNYAFIDSQNVNLGVRKLGWKLGWKKFRTYLKEKYGVETAYLFLGFIEGNYNLYRSLQKSGFVLIFRETLQNADGTIKGNCDAELVLQAMIDYNDYHQAVIVTGDGDFACLVRHLLKESKLERILVPNQSEYSVLLRRSAPHCIDFMNSLKKKLEYKKSTP